MAPHRRQAAVQDKDTAQGDSHRVADRHRGDTCPAGTLRGDKFPVLGEGSPCPAEDIGSLEATHTDKGRDSWAALAVRLGAGRDIPEASAIPQAGASSPGRDIQGAGRQRVDPALVAPAQADRQRAGQLVGQQRVAVRNRPQVCSTLS